MPINHEKMIQDSRRKAKLNSVALNTVTGAALGAGAGGMAAINYNNPSIWRYLTNGSVKHPASVGQYALGGAAIGAGAGLLKGAFDSSADEAEILHNRAYKRLKTILKREPSEREFRAYLAKRNSEIGAAKINKSLDSFNHVRSLGSTAVKIRSLMESQNQPEGETQMNNRRPAPNHRDFMSNQSFRESVQQEPQILRPNTYNWWEGNRLREDIYNEQQEARFMESYSRLMEADFIDGLGSKHFGADVEEVIQATEEAVKSGNPKWKEMLSKLDAMVKNFASKFKREKAVQEINPWEVNAQNLTPEMIEFRRSQAAKAKQAAKEQFLNSLKKRVESIKALANANKKMLMAAGAGAGILGLGAAAGYMMNGEDED